MDYKFKLKNCRHCGGTAKLKEMGDGRYAIECTNCGMEFRDKNLADLLDFWNNPLKLKKRRAIRKLHALVAILTPIITAGTDAIQCINDVESLLHDIFGDDDQPEEIEKVEIEPDEMQQVREE